MMKNKKYDRYAYRYIILIFVYPTIKNVRFNSRSLLIRGPYMQNVHSYTENLSVDESTCTNIHIHICTHTYFLNNTNK